MADVVPTRAGAEGFLTLLSRLCGESTGGQMEQTLLHLTAPYTKQSALGSKIPVPAHEH